MKIKKYILGLIMVTSISTCLIGCEESSKETITSIETEVTIEDTKEKVIKTDGKLGNFEVKVKDSEVVSNDEGEKILKIDATFKNNSDDTISYDLAVYPLAFQDGIELEQAFDSEVLGQLGENAGTYIKKGVEIDVSMGFKLKNTISNIELEIEEFLGETGEKVIKDIEIDYAK